MSLGESDQNQVKTLNLDLGEHAHIDLQNTNGELYNDGEKLADGDLGESNMAAQRKKQMEQAAKVTNTMHSESHNGFELCCVPQKTNIVSAEHLMSMLALKVAQHQHAAREALEEAAHLGEVSISLLCDMWVIFWFVRVTLFRPLKTRTQWTNRSCTRC